MRSARLVACIFAVVLCAWFALDVRQQQQTARARALIARSAPLSHAEARQARSALDAAAQLNPDSEVSLLRAQLATDLGDRPQAVRILEQVTRQEPKNAVAWLDLAQTARSKGLVIYALAQIAALVPHLSGEH